MFFFEGKTFAQDNPPFNFVITTWTQDEGLPQNSINDIVQTDDGYLWLATFGGLARFNGVSFKTFNKFNSPGLVSDRILSLFNDNEGRLWISTEDGLSCYYNGIFKTFTERDGYKLISSLEVKQDKHGTIWILTYPGFYKFYDGKFIKQEVVEDEKLRSRAMAGEADFFVPFRDEIYAVIDKKVVYCRSIGKYPHIEILDIVENPKGSLWLSTTSNSLINIKNGVINQYKIQEGTGINFIKDLFVDSDKRLWIGASKGLTILKDNSFYNITSKDGLPNSQIEKIFQDNEDNYWIGTNAGGLSRIRRSIISNYGKSDGLDTDQILALVLKQDNSLLIGTNGGGIYELRNNKISKSPLNKYITQKFIWSLFEDSQKRIWGYSNDLFYIDEQGKFIDPASREYDLFNTKAFYESKDGAIWIGYQFGLLRYFNNKFTNYSTKQGLTETDVRCILEDNNQKIWVGTIDGLFSINRGKVQSYSSIPGLRNYYFRAIYQDKEGVMWFGTYGGGLLRFKNNNFFSFSTDNGMIDNVVSHIIEDDNGYFWMGSNRGIQRISRRELNDFADGKTTSFFAYKYDKTDGMNSSETNGGFQPSAVKDKYGNIYFPTISGVTVVNTKEIKKDEIVPPVHISHVLINGKERKLNDLRINYDSSNVEIYFDILSYSLPGKNRAKYIMEGYDNGWNDAGDLRYARYTSLPPGEYTFRVVGSNKDNVWNEQGTSIAINVLPPFWMTWWFRSILGLLFISIGPLFYYRRIKTLKNEQKLHHEFSEKLINSQEQERSRIAQELHDSLGQELLLIKNRAMLGLKNYAGDDKVKKQLEYISDYSENAISKVRQISHNLRPPELDRLGITETIRALLNEMKQTSVIKFDVYIDEIDGLIEKEKEINLLRIVQEAVANIIKHSGATKISLKISRYDYAIKIFIDDNGRGFDAVFNSESEKKGLGLSGMKERANILGGNFSIVSETGKGTKIFLEIPFKYVN